MSSAKYPRTCPSTKAMAIVVAGKVDNGTARGGRG